MSDQAGQNQLLGEIAKQLLDLKEEVQRIRLSPRIDPVSPREPVSLGRGPDVLARYLLGGVTVAEIESELRNHPNPVTLQDIELVLEADDSKTLVLHGGKIDRYDYENMSRFWSSFKDLTTKAKLGLRYTEQA